MNSKIAFKTSSSLLSCFLLAPLLSGCIAAAVPMVAVLGFGSAGLAGYKTYQSATSGEVSIGFSENDVSIKNQAALSKITRPAIWPTSQVEPITADGLKNSQKFRSVISPIQVSETISQNRINSSVGFMTENELISTFKKVCSSARADSIIYMGEPTISGATNFFSLKRPALTYESKMLIYVCTEQWFSYVGSRRLEIETTMPEAMGTNSARTSGIPGDVIQFAGETSAEKLIEIIAPSGNFPDAQTLEESKPKKEAANTGFNENVADVQLALTKLGYKPGPIDGLWGGKTKDALKEFQADNELEPTGELDDNTLGKLLSN